MEGGAPKRPSHGMDFHMEISDMPTPYVSAPSSPCRGSSFNGLPYFDGVLGSPTSGLPIVPFKWESKPGVAKSAEEDDFEFETSERFESLIRPHDRRIETSEMINQEREQQQQQQQQQQQNVGDLPIMSFADELFYNGQLPPLKPPPRLQFGSNRSSSVSSPRSPGSVSCGLLYGRSFNNNNIDPFTAALDEIRKEDVGTDHGNPCRRTRSFSSLTTFRWGRNRSSGPQHHDKEMGPLEPTWQFALVPKEPTKPTKSASVGPTDDTWQFALVPKEPTKPIKSSLSGPRPTRESIFPGPRVDTWETRKNNSSRWATFLKWSKRKMNKAHLFRSASERWAHPKLNLRNQTAVMRKREDAMSLSFRSVHEAYYNGKKSVHEDMRKKTIIPYKPSGLFVCFGFSSKATKYRK